MMMPPTCGDPRWAGILRFQMDWNPLPMILLELTMVRVLPAQEIPQQVGGEPTISMTALLELLKDADPEMKAKLRLALLT